MSDEELPDILSEDLGYLLGWVALGASNDDGCEAARAIGAAIVGCEEMQAIKSALRRAYWQYPVNIRTRIMQRDRLPDVVVEWVLS